MENPLSCTLCFLPEPKQNSLLKVWLALESFNRKEEVHGVTSKLTLEYNPVQAHKIEVCLYGSALKLMRKRYNI